MLSGIVMHTRDKNHAVPLFLFLRTESDHLGTCCVYKVFNKQLTDNDKFNTSCCAAIVCFSVCAWFGWLPNQNVGLRLFCEHLEVVKYLLLV